ncbi:MAG: hypothetical protein D6681_11250 [Calditrichaeota bacterium]|nr:MAG: hypothetical protein D6681_11250 [Calditrichota bacterium]
MSRRMLSIFFLGWPLAAFAQAPLDSLAVGNYPSKISDIESFWAMLQLGGGIGYVIMGVLALGIFLIVLKAINLLMDWLHSRSLQAAAFGTMSFAEIEALAREHHNSLLGNILSHLIDFYQAGGEASNIHQELVVYLDQETERFETFRGWLNFLSDSAGALGLLGTVWGVFLTFFGGNLDSEKILNGMGVALVTTLLGLVVSLIINLFHTQIHSAFQRRLGIVNRKADELRLYLLHSQSRAPEPTLDRRRSARAAAAAESPQPAATSGPASEPAPAPTGAPAPPQLKVLKVRAREIPAGEALKGALQLQVTDHLGTPVVGQKILLKTEGAITLGRGASAAAVTDGQGLAPVDIHAGEVAGPGRVWFWLEGHEESRGNISFTVKPGAPARIAVAGGNDQFATVGSVLPEPFRIVVTDRFGNVVPEVPVQFRVTLGEGSFAGGNHQYVTRTDASGVAESRLRLGNKTGFHAVEAVVKGLKEKAEFRILSKAS